MLILWQILGCTIATGLITLASDQKLRAKVASFIARNVSHMGG